MKKIRSVLWGIKNGFLYCPLVFTLYLLIHLTRATLSVYTTVKLSQIISHVGDIVAGGGSIRDIIYDLLLWGVLNVVCWAAVELRWRISDDVIPIQSGIGASKHLIRTSKHIPLRDYDKNEFCDAYARYEGGIRSLPQFVKSCIGQLVGIYQFILAMIELSVMHPAFGTVLAVFLVLGYVIQRDNSDIINDVRIKTTAPRRRADYLSGMFFGKYNRETRMYGLRKKYIEEWHEQNERVLDIEVEGDK